MKIKTKLSFLRDLRIRFSFFVGTYRICILLLERICCECKHRVVKLVYPRPRLSKLVPAFTSTLQHQTFSNRFILLNFQRYIKDIELSEIKRVKERCSTVVLFVGCDSIGRVEKRTKQHFSLTPKKCTEINL